MSTWSASPKASTGRQLNRPLGRKSVDFSTFYGTHQDIGVRIVTDV